jgi:hypothetical protein
LARQTPGFFVFYDGTVPIQNKFRAEATASRPNSAPANASWKFCDTQQRISERKSGCRKEFSFRKSYPVSLNKKYRALVATYRHSTAKQFENAVWHAQIVTGL